MTLRDAYTQAGVEILPVSQDRGRTILKINANVYKLELEYLPTTGLSYNVPVARQFTVDAPYDIFAIPYSDTFRFTGNGSTITCSAEVALSVAADIGTKGDSAVYDVQLLPYCPFDTSAWPAGTYTTYDTNEYS